MTLNNIKKLLLLVLLVSISSSIHLTAKDINVLAYIDRGIKYYPKYVKRGMVKYGKASWYGKPFHGRLTANGERYNMYKMTAAHRTYAMNTVLKVTNLANKRSVKVRVNDRGPFYSSRAIDLSYGAAKKLGIVKKGIGKIKIEVISSGGKHAKKRQYRSKKRVSSKKKHLKQKKHFVKKSKIKKIRVAKAHSSKVYRKNTKAKKTYAKKSIKTHKVQVASFLNKKSAALFAKKHHLKNVVIVKKNLKAQKRVTYAVTVKCTAYEAKKLLKSKKFSGAYKVS